MIATSISKLQTSQAVMVGIAISLDEWDMYAAADWGKQQAFAARVGRQAQLEVSTYFNGNAPAPGVNQ